MRDRECVALLQWALPRMGLRWPGFRRVRGQVCKRVSRRMAGLGLPDVAAYRARLEADPAEWSFLEACCWISVSRFLRDRGVFEALAREILPELARSARARGASRLFAWSAGCASGEEPYGLRLVWELEVAPALPGTELDVVATDANAELLERARRGVYAGSALKELPVPWRERCFAACEGGHRLREETRSRVRFLRQDIRETMPVGPFDLVLCRNLAFTYFALDLQRAIAGKLAQRLVPGGALLLGAHEALPGPAPLQRDERVPGLYRALLPRGCGGS